MSQSIVTHKAAYACGEKRAVEIGIDGKALLAFQFALLAVVGVWTATDPHVEGLIASFVAVVANPANATAAIDSVVASAGRTRLFVFGGLLLAVVGAAGGWLGLRLIRKRGGKSLRSLLLFNMLVGCWCGFFLSYPWLSWQGKRIRMVRQTAQFEMIARELRSDWPMFDGELPEIGPFMAYPFGEPSALILLTPPSVSSGGTTISTVERSRDGAIRFLLSGAEGGDWIEWHPPAGRPGSFIGGLNDQHRISQYVPLVNDWYLVRYGDPPWG